MSQEDKIQDIEARLYAAGISVSAMCYEARVTTMTWWKWKKGKAKPRADKWGAALAATERLLSEERKRA